MIKGKRVVCPIQARMNSTRLPGKVLMPLVGEPVLKRIVERLRPSKYLDEVIIATTVDIADEMIVNFCQKNKIKFYRGSEEDVLKRILEAAQVFQAEIVVHITGDCPLVDFRYVDKVIETLVRGKYDYVSNAIKMTFPDGFDVEAFYTKTLDKVNKLTNNSLDREHVTYYIYNHPEKFRIKNIEALGKMRWPELCLTLDEEKDYKLLSLIYKKLYLVNNLFAAEDVVDFLLKNPQYLNINKNIKRNSVSHRV